MENPEDYEAIIQRAVTAADELAEDPADYIAGLKFMAVKLQEAIDDAEEDSTAQQVTDV